MRSQWLLAGLVLCLAACATSAARVEEPLATPASASVDVGLPAFGTNDAVQRAAPAVEEPEVPPEEVHYPFHQPLPSLSELAQGPAMRLANLSPAECRKLLAEKELAVERWRGPAPGVATPLRITGPLEGVELRVPSAKTPYGLLDCRLALALAEMSRVLAEHGVVSVRIDNFYRPRARLPRRKKLSQHAHGLAADVVEFTLENGEVLNVERDWQGVRGEPPCGPEARLVEASDRAVRLRNLVCAIAARGVFHHILTPGYDAAHRNHLHLDIKRDERWFGVR